MMDRHAVFIDGGYVIAAGGLLTLNAKKRHLVGCDIEALIEAVVDLTSTTSGLPILRTYWYDGAYGGVPSFSQTLIADLPSVKLRLGRISQGVQKGVDSLLVTDLMTLAQERAVSAAFLMTGDEDIRPGVIACQALGVRLTLIGVEGRNPNEFTQSATLLSEADGSLMLDQAFLAPHFQRRSPLPREVDGAKIAASLGVGATPEDYGEAFGRFWAANLTIFELRRLDARRPRIPKPVDSMLMLSFGGLVPSHSGSMLRAGFWKGIDAAHP